MSSHATLYVLSNVATFVISVSASAFISGTRWGRLEQKVQNISEDISEIKGMFTLTLKDDHNSKDGLIIKR